MIETIAKLVQVVTAFSPAENGSAIHDYFEQDKKAEGVVIVDSEKPMGILMRNDFYQKIGRQFGYSLYMKRDVTLLMKRDITCVDMNCDISKFGYIAMNREQDNIYDFIVVLEDGKYAGVVSISEFLNEMSKTKEREIELLQNQQLILEQANKAEKIHRLEIEQKNASIKNLLDHAGQGFLFFGNDLLISEEYSKECDEIFGFAVGKRNFLQVMGNFVDEDTLNVIQDAFAHVFRDQNKTRNKVYLSILPEEIRVGAKYIQTEYKVLPNQAGKSVMMILTDITEKKALELKSAEEKNNIKLIIRAISSKSEIDQAIDDLHEFVERNVWQLLDGSRDPKATLQHIFRVVHTMKGDFSLNSLHHTAAGLHQLEDTLSLLQKRTEPVSMEEIREFMRQIDCDQLLREDIAIITEALGTQFFEKDDVYTVDRQRLREIKNKVETIFRDEEQAVILRLLHSLFYVNMKDIIKNYNEYIQTLAERLGKNIGNIKVNGEDVYIDRDRYLAFIKSLVHVFRNIADHGIEDPETRVGCGKPEYGVISCTLERSEDKLILCLGDDGKGIDLEAIRRKAVEKGIYSAAEIEKLPKEQIMDTIFLDDFSTKNTVDLYSGRGVGMAAVRSEVEKIGGKVTVESEKGRYTRFKFMMPLY